MQLNVSADSRHFIGHFKDDFYRSDDPTHSVKELFVEIRLQFHQNHCTTLQRINNQTTTSKHAALQGSQSAAARHTRTDKIWSELGFDATKYLVREEEWTWGICSREKYLGQADVRMSRQ